MEMFHRKTDRHIGRLTPQQNMVIRQIKDDMHVKIIKGTILKHLEI